MAPVMPSNIKLGCKWLEKTNAVTYAIKLITALKSFVVQATKERKRRRRGKIV
jgi:hypothetical protein